jgi:nucleoside phosphorylase
MSIQADIVLVTVNEHEVNELLAVFKDATGIECSDYPLQGRVYRDLGTINGTSVFHAHSQMGSGSAGATQQTTERAIQALRPKAVINIGIAFGVNEKKQKIGEILISKQLRLYDLQRVGKKQVIHRGGKPDASTTLVDFFEGIALTSWKRAKASAGVVLSGEKLVDNFNFRKKLIKLEPEAIGGEMEGAGVYAACHDRKVDWIVVKAICDWGDGDKSKNKRLRQKKAARSAAEFLMHCLQRVPLTSLLDDRPARASRRVGTVRRGQPPSPEPSPPPPVAPAAQPDTPPNAAFNLVPLPERGMNSVRLGSEKNKENGSFLVDCSFHLIVGAEPVKLMAIDGTYFAPFGCACFLADRLLKLDGGEPLQVRGDGVTLHASILLEAGSEHQLACSWRLRPPSIELTPADCDAGDLEMMLAFRKLTDLEYRTVFLRFRFDDADTKLRPTTEIRVPEGLSDQDLERGARELNMPPHIHNQLKPFSPCSRYLIAVTRSSRMLENTLLRPEHRQWLRDVQAHARTTAER